MFQTFFGFFTDLFWHPKDEVSRPEGPPFGSRGPEGPWTSRRLIYLSNLLTWDSGTTTRAPTTNWASNVDRRLRRHSNHLALTSPHLKSFNASFFRCASVPGLAALVPFALNHKMDL